MIAVGRVAERELGAPYVRHPSHGGAPGFRAGLAAALTVAGRRRTMPAMRAIPGLPASRTTRALWLVVALVAVALVAVALVSTVRAGDEESSETAQYITEVNKALVTTGPLLVEVNRSYRRFREDPASVDIAELEGAGRSLREVRGRVAAVPTPAIAADLRRAVLRALDGQIDFAGEVALLAAYLPAVAEVSADLGEATSRLRRDVNAARTVPAQSAAFDAYAVRAGTLADRLRAVEPPSSFAGARDAEAGRVEELGSSAASVADGLEAGQATRVNRSLDRFAAAATGSRVAEERREAVLLYGRRLRQLARLQTLADRERQELEAAGA